MPVVKRAEEVKVRVTLDRSKGLADLCWYTDVPIGAPRIGRPSRARGIAVRFIMGMLMTGT